MESLIFLKLDQKKALDDANIGVKSLTLETLNNYVNYTDYRDIVNTSCKLQCRGSLLYRFGFRNGPDNVSVPPPLRSYYDNPILSKAPENVVINAACQTPNSIVLWEEEYNSSDTNDMFGRSMVNILKALSSVMLFEKLKQTDQFAICLLNY